MTSRLARVGAALICAIAAIAPLGAMGAEKQTVGALVPFRTAPFPYDGVVPDTGEPFLDVRQGFRKGHTAPRGGVYWSNENYSDNRVLLAFSHGFRPDLPGVMVVYFHGNDATLEDDVIGRQRVLDQFEESGINGVLVAPQFAVDALDSSAGKFWQKGAFAQFLTEADSRLARLAGTASDKRIFARMPIVLIAYSGGYEPAAYALTVGNADKRVAGVVLLDAVFGEVNRFADYLTPHGGTGFFLSAYTDSSEAGNKSLGQLLQSKDIDYSTTLPPQLRPGYVGLVASPGTHADFVTDAWVTDPIAWTLKAMRIGR